MNSEWREFLEQQGAQLSGNAVTGFADAATELNAAAHETVLCDLSHQGLIRARGEDSQTFLQGQLTNDIRSVDKNTHQLSGYCSPKGRLLALFQLFMRNDNYYLQFPQALLESTLKRLRMYVMRSKVILDDVSNELVRFAVAGPVAEKMLGERLSELPGGEFESVTTADITALRLNGAVNRFILCGEPAAMQPLWQALRDAGAVPVGNSVWEWLNVQAGQPDVVTETIEAFVPQMLNLQLINGVSFKKGCYTGQEVVARMQYLGKLKRRMYLAHTDAQQLPHPGDELYSPESGSGQGAGKLVTVASSPNGGYDMLAVLEINGVEGGEFYLDESRQTPLTLKQLPYEFEPASPSSPSQATEH